MGLHHINSGAEKWWAVVVEGGGGRREITDQQTGWGLEDGRWYVMGGREWWWMGNGLSDEWRVMEDRQWMMNGGRWMAYDGRTVDYSPGRGWWWWAMEDDIFFWYVTHSFAITLPHFIPTLHHHHHHHHPHFPAPSMYQPPQSTWWCKTISRSHPRLLLPHQPPHSINYCL